MLLLWEERRGSEKYRTKQIKIKKERKTEMTDRGKLEHLVGKHMKATKNLALMT